ncbi:PREDICTED: prostatic spermine-binding protein-like [Ipomoea nil]|uniref:prostatic spermine-binding protein-like n=1 Tax=Ipomoea nil TaxID=35883 RepID=UPI0009009ABA|nr:PREDICTED: prostatic spermine-binding protein-like [Ipomoea nil]
MKDLRDAMRLSKIKMELENLYKNDPFCSTSGTKDDGSHSTLPVEPNDQKSEDHHPDKTERENTPRNDDYEADEDESSTDENSEEEDGIAEDNNEDGDNNEEHNYGDDSDDGDSDDDSNDDDDDDIERSPIIGKIVMIPPTDRYYPLNGRND